MALKLWNGRVDYARARAQLIEHLRLEIREDRVLEAMSRVPRELFVPVAVRHMAYEDHPLPIGMGQTISQPFIVALMTSALGLKGEEKVLEVGTGSGYQAAILSLLCRQVVTVERLAPLAEEARKRLAELGYTNVEVRVAGKNLGWPAQASYDAILVAAAAPHLPRELLRQLAPRGRLVVPVGSREEQELLRVTRRDKGAALVETLGDCRFVPLMGPGAWGEDDGF